GYSKEELTELYNFLESINEPCEEFLNILIKRNKTLEFWDGTWFTDHSAGNKIPVTIQQLKEILQPMEIVNLMGYSVLVDNTEQAMKLQEIAIKQGFEWEHGDEKIRHLDEKSFQFGYKGKKIITYYFRKNHYQD